MSHKDVALVMSRRIQPLSHKFVLVALADHRNGETGLCNPSVAAIADMVNLKDRQVKAVLGKLISAGFVSVPAGRKGGRSSSRYVLNVESISAQPFTLSRQPKGSAGVHSVTSRGAIRDIEGCSGVHPNQEEEQSGKREARKLAAPGSSASQDKSKGMTLAGYRASLTPAGEKPIPPGDPIFDYCDAAGIEPEMLDVAWQCFKDRFLDDEPDTRHTNWRGLFARSVRSRWFGLWRTSPTGVVTWTDAGLQARHVMHASRRQADSPAQEATEQPVAEPVPAAAPHTLTRGRCNPFARGRSRPVPPTTHTTGSTA